MALESFICREAAGLGFAAVGFAAAAPCQSFDRFNTWLNRGNAGGMAYLARHRQLRADPRLIMPEVRSIIVVGARYPADRNGGLFSNYCRGSDYHVVLRAKLRQLAHELGKVVSIPLKFRICVDSAPVLEREWAVRAGLGWIGKQGSLVHPQWGCTLFLAELFVNLELPPASVIASQCGNCTRCVDACPSGAIQPDGFVDARRCLSYLTIEHHGELPAAVGKLSRFALCGCDRCTAVCPFNPPGDEAILPEFNPRQASRPTPAECLAMDTDDFRRHFEGTAVDRVGLSRLQRNAAAVRAIHH